MIEIPVWALIVLSILAGIVLWFLSALILGLLVGGMTKVRDRQVPRPRIVDDEVRRQAERHRDTGVR